MDIGGNKPAPAAAFSQAANRVEPTSSGAKAVATELPKADAVRAIGDVPAVKVEVERDRQGDREAQALAQARAQALRDFVQNRNVVDPRTQELVFRTVDTRTGAVIKQFPDEARLRLREYLNQSRDAQANDPASAKVERLA